MLDNYESKLQPLAPLASNPHDSDRLSDRPSEKLIAFIEPLISPLGFEVAGIEIQTHHGNVLRLFIDHLGNTSTEGTVGIEDCAQVSRALDEPLDASLEIEAIFHGTSYDLEVSSPGVDRPLRTARDFTRFLGRRIRIHTYRALRSDELGHATYAEKNPKQKNFIGILKGFQNEKVLIALIRDEKTGRKKAADTNSVEELMIPLPLISKANLEPVFEIGEN